MALVTQLARGAKKTHLLQIAFIKSNIKNKFETRLKIISVSEISAKTREYDFG
jgi:hypothetical protein